MTLVRLDRLGSGPNVRRERIDLGHVSRLTERGGWPPILVREVNGKLQVIDGHHRKAAAGRLKWEEIEAEVIHCSDAEALERAVAANLSHGLPLSIPERKTAALRMIRETDWSDARIATACGLLRTRVAQVRVQHGGSRRLNSREGADGRHRPTPEVAEENRQRAAEMAQANPEIPTRKLAQATGVSVGTAHKVKADPERHLHAVQAPEPPSGIPDAPTVGDLLPTIPEDWTQHDAAGRTNETRDFFRWLNGWVRPSRFDKKAKAMAATCPPDAAEEVARGARWMAQRLQAFATEVEKRRSLEIAR